MFMSLIQQRRSIRHFSATPVAQEKIAALVEAALRAPSSRGFNPWEFIVVTDKALLEQLSRAKQHGSSFLKDAPLGIVVCADTRKSDVWIEDAAIASIFLHLAAASLDLGSCWIQIRKRMHDPDRTSQDYVAGLLGLPPHLAVASIIAIGSPAQATSAHPKETLQYEKIHRNRYGAA